MEKETSVARWTTGQKRAGKLTHGRGKLFMLQGGGEAIHKSEIWTNNPFIFSNYFTTKSFLSFSSWWSQRFLFVPFTLSPFLPPIIDI